MVKQQRVSSRQTRGRQFDGDDCSVRIRYLCLDDFKTGRTEEVRYVR